MSNLLDIHCDVVPVRKDAAPGVRRGARAASWEANGPE